MYKLKFYLNIYLLAFSVLFFYSCSSVVQLAFGVKTPRVESLKEQKKILEKWDIDTTQLYFIKRSFILNNSFDDPIYALDTFSSRGFSPIQFRIYDRGLDFYTGWEQCIGPLKYYSFFQEDTITKIHHKALNYSISLKNDLNFISENPDTLYKLIKSQKYDYVIIALWSGWLGSFSKDMLKELDGFYKTTSKKVLFIKANLSIDEEMKEKMEGSM